MLIQSWLQETLELVVPRVVKGSPPLPPIICPQYDVISSIAGVKPPSLRATEEVIPSKKDVNNICNEPIQEHKQQVQDHQSVA